MKKKIVKFLFIMMFIIGCSALFGETKADDKIVGTKIIAEGDVLSFSVIASDPDGDVVTIVAETLPVGATLSPAIEIAGKYVSDFNWIPNFDQAGIIDLWLIAEDSGGLQDWAKVVITITNTNRPPVLDNI